MDKPFLQEHFHKTVAPELKKTRGYANVHQIPKISKVVLNTGFEATIDRNTLKDTISELATIAGQQPVQNKARKSISNFKLREGMVIGAKVTLRGRNMYDFLSRLLNIALPGIRDFRGVSTKMDGQGNYTLGITDHTIFPEVSSDQKLQLGLDITIVTTAKSDDEGRELLRLMGMPFRRRTETTASQPAAAATA